MRLRHAISAAILCAGSFVFEAVADTASYSGDLNSPEGSWDRAFADGTCCSGLGPVTYNTQFFYVNADGNYDIGSIQNGYDGYLFLYQGAFDPTNQSLNFVAGDDDGNFGIGSSNIDGVALTANTQYILVDTGFAAGDAGTYTTTISGPGVIYLLTLPVNMTTADVLLGDLAISSNKSLARVLIQRLGSLREASLIPQHGFFLQTSYNENDIDADESQPGYNYRSNRITAGLDHKLTPSLVVGAALSYEDGTSNLDDSGDEIKRTATSLSAFSSYQLTELMHAQGIVSYTRSDFDLDTDAKSDTSADELSLLLGLGYHNQIQRVALDPFARVQYIYSDIDGYRYSNGDDVSAQRARSLRSMFGVDTSMLIQTGMATLTPRASLAWEHEYGDEARHLYVADNRLETSDPDRDYFTTSIGLEAAFSDELTAYVNYSTSIGATDQFATAVAGVQLRF
ncbi:MAG: autotransporter outer membrane beta-barrel domain-containing protein [Pseudomonadaceae bacterium]